MSKGRRRPQHSKRSFTSASERYAAVWDEDSTPVGPARYVAPQDWQTAWATNTDQVCRTIHIRWARRLYPFNPLAQDDLQDWLWLEACEFAQHYQPKPAVDMVEKWEASLASVLTKRVRWHWAVFQGRTMIYTDGSGARRAGVVDSIEAMIERGERHQTMNATAARIVNGSIGAWRPMSPERFVLMLELADGVPEDRPDPEPDTCSEPACTRPIQGRGLCAMHLQRAVVQWGKDIDQEYPTRWASRSDTCTAEGCDQPAWQSERCRTHWLDARPRCTAEGCDKAAEAKGLCALHRKRLARTGTLDDPEAPTLLCTVDGCERPHLAKGLCSAHYKAARRAS